MKKLYVFGDCSAMFFDYCIELVKKSLIEKTISFNRDLSLIIFNDEKIVFLKDKLNSLKEQIFKFNNEYRDTEDTPEEYIKYLRSVILYKFSIQDNELDISHSAFYEYFNLCGLTKYSLVGRPDAIRLETHEIVNLIHFFENDIGEYITLNYDIINSLNIDFSLIINFILFEELLSKYNKLLSSDDLLEIETGKKPNIKLSRALILLNELDILTNLNDKYTDIREISRQVARMLNTTESAINTTITAILSNYSTPHNPYKSKKNTQFAKELRELLDKYALKD